MQLAPEPRVPVLVDPAAGVVLRAHLDNDVPAIVELANDPLSQEYLPLPDPYGSAQAWEFIGVCRRDWQTGRSWGWAIEAERDGRVQFCGSVTVGAEGDLGTVGFSLHPGARGRSLTTAALRLAVDYALDVGGLRVLRWTARVGNWASRRTAAAVGFRFDGTVRGLLEHRGERVDGWSATITAEDPRADLRLAPPPTLSTRLPLGETVHLRALRPGDADRVVEACRDERSQHWLISLPRPYESRHARAYIESTLEQTATGTGWTWAVTDGDDQLLAAISLEGAGGYHRRREIGYWVHPDARGRSLMSTVVPLLTAYAEAEGAHTLIIQCAAGNHASRHVAEHSGYREVGRLIGAEPLGDGTRDDLVIYARP